MTAAAPDLAAAVRARLPLRTTPGVPELRLHLAAPGSGLRELAEAFGGGAPYWAFAWGGGVALARRLLDRPGEVAGRSVVDLGADSGLAALAAARAGAARVLAVDVDPLAAAAVALNAEANGLAVAFEAADLLDGPAPAADLLLAGDVFYDGALAARVAPFLDRAAAAGCEVWVGDPGRGDLPLHRLERLAAYDLPDMGGGSGCAAYRWR